MPKEKKYEVSGKFLLTGKRASFFTHAKNKKLAIKTVKKEFFGDFKPGRAILIKTR